MKILRNIFFFSFILVFVGCLDENDSIEVEGDGEDYKRSLVAISRDENLFQYPKNDVDVEKPADVERDIERKSKNSSKKMFHPTNEWKIVEEDEMIPPGLHIRMNLQTGKKEAKLLEKEATAKDGDKPEEKELSYDELKRVLSNIKVEKQPTDDPSSFRTMDQIKEDLKDMNMDVKLDSEIIKELLGKLGGDDDDLSEEDKLLLLEDLEYHLHQIDNANMFVDVGGLSRLVRIINTTMGFEVQSSALMAISAALQSNPHAQVVAVNEGLMEFCLRIAMTTASQGVRGRAVHALSAMMRNFPFAQKRFADLGGFEFLVGLLGEEPTVDRTVIKIVSLVSDLMEEQVTTKQDEYLNPDYKKEKLAQYDLVQLVDRILGTEWCRLLPRLLESDDLDIKEKTVKAMWSWIDSCKNHFLSVLPTLNDLRNKFQNHNDEYSLEVCGIVERIVGKIDAKDEL